MGKLKATNWSRAFLRSLSFSPVKLVKNGRIITAWPWRKKTTKTNIKKIQFHTKKIGYSLTMKLNRTTKQQQWLFLLIQWLSVLIKICYAAALLSSCCIGKQLLTLMSLLSEWELKLINISWLTWLWIISHCSFKQAFILAQVTDLMDHLVAKAKSQTLFLTHRKVQNSA